MASRGFAFLAPLFKRPLRPGDIPAITDPVKAARFPELALLSALAYGKTDRGVAVVWAAIPAFCKLDDEQARFCFDVAVSALSEADQRRIEAMLKDSPYGEEFAKKFQAHGYEQARAEGARKVLLRLLPMRFGEPLEVDLARIQAAEYATLKRWAARLITARILAEVFDDPT